MKQNANRTAQNQSGSDIGKATPKPAAGTLETAVPTPEPEAFSVSDTGSTSEPESSNASGSTEVEQLPAGEENDSTVSNEKKESGADVAEATAAEEESATKTEDDTSRTTVAGTGVTIAEEKQPVPGENASPTTEVAVLAQTPVTEKPREGGGLFPVLLIVVLVAAVAVIGFLLLGKRKNKRKQQSTEYACGETESVSKPVPVQPMISLSAGGAQTIGKRDNQEDSFCYTNWHSREEVGRLGFLAAVSDGIGGLDNSEMASQTAMKNMRSRFLRQGETGNPADGLLELAAAAQEDVLALNRTRNGGSKAMGATLVSAYIRGDKLWILSIGDSRIYLFRSGAVLPLNRPHVFGKENKEELALNIGGRVSDARRDRMLTAYLGQENLKKIDRTVNPIKLLPGDRVLLMSDGVFGTIGEDEIARCISQNPEESAKEMIRRVENANKPHQDNATVVVVAVD